MTFMAVDKSHDFTGPYDITVQRQMHLEMWLAQVNRVRWKRLIRDPRLLYDVDYKYDYQNLKWDWFSSTDHLYNEQVARRYHPAIVIPIFIKREGAVQDLIKLGVKEGRPATAKFSIPVLEMLQIPPRAVAIGDVLEYEGHAYVLDTVIPDPETEWLSSNVPFILLCKLNTLDQERQ